MLLAHEVWRTNGAVFPRIGPDHPFDGYQSFGFQNERPGCIEKWKTQCNVEPWAPESYQWICQIVYLDFYASLRPPKFFGGSAYDNP